MVHLGGSSAGGAGKVRVLSVQSFENSTLGHSVVRAGGSADSKLTDEVFFGLGVCPPLAGQLGWSAGRTCPRCRKVRIWQRVLGAVASNWQRRQSGVPSPRLLYNPTQHDQHRGQVVWVIASDSPDNRIAFFEQVDGVGNFFLLDVRRQVVPDMAERLQLEAFLRIRKKARQHSERIIRSGDVRPVS